MSSLCGWRFKKQFDISSVGDTLQFRSSDTVDRELEQVILYLLLCHETDWKIRVPKNVVFMLTEYFKERYFDISLKRSVETAVNN